jgi:DNA primase
LTGKKNILGGFFSKEKIAEIKEASNIREVISDYVPLKKAGKNYQGLCPFHSEKTPSFIISEERQIFHCFGCGAGGDVFHFLMKIDNISFPEAVREVAKIYGIPLPERELAPQESKELSFREKLFEVNELVTNYYHVFLKEKKETAGWNYLKKRGISPEIIDEYRLGYAGTSGKELLTYLKKKGIPLNLGEKVGLTVPKKGGGYYDFFRNRIIFPIIDQSSKVIGFGGRVLDETLPKYLNSPDSPIYNKSQSMYGLNIAKNFIRKENLALVVEGYFDLLALAQCGIKDVVATLGTALTQGPSNAPGHIKILTRYTKNIIIIFDGDKAGINAMRRSLPPFLEEGISPRVLILPSGMDPDKYIRKVKGRGFREDLKQTIPMVDFFIEEAIKAHPRFSIEGKLTIVNEIIPILKKLKNDIERDYYIEKVSGRLEIKEERIGTLVKKSKKRAETEIMKTEKNFINRNVAERLIVQLMLLKDQTVARIKESSIIKDFTNRELQRLGDYLLEIYHNQGKIDPLKVMDLVKDENLRCLLSKLVLTEESSIIDAPRTLEDCIRKIRLNKIQKEIERINSEMKIVQEKRDDDIISIHELLVKRQNLLAEEKRFKTPRNTHN